MMRAPTPAVVGGDGYDPAVTDRDVWQVRVVLRATEAELERATEAIARALCPEEFHDGPCATPWTMMTSRVSDQDPDEAAALRALVDDE